jgi:hypothetical protein
MRTLRGIPKPTTGESPPAWCPRCGARVPPGQVGQSAGRRVLYCTVCGEYWMMGRRRARRPSPVERRLARRDLFAGRGLDEPVSGA